MPLGKDLLPVSKDYGRVLILFHKLSIAMRLIVTKKENVNQFSRVI